MHTNSRRRKTMTDKENSHAQVEGQTAKWGRSIETAGSEEPEVDGQPRRCGDTPGL
jgi:hypothetical protein